MVSPVGSPGGSPVGSPGGSSRGTLGGSHGVSPSVSPGGIHRGIPLGYPPWVSPGECPRGIPRGTPWGIPWGILWGIPGRYPGVSPGDTRRISPMGYPGGTQGYPLVYQGILRVILRCIPCGISPGYPLGDSPEGILWQIPRGIPGDQRTSAVGAGARGPLEQQTPRPPSQGSGVGGYCTGLLAARPTSATEGWASVGSGTVWWGLAASGRLP